MCNHGGGAFLNGSKGWAAPGLENAVRRTTPPATRLRLRNCRISCQVLRLLIVQLPVLLANCHACNNMQTMHTVNVVGDTIWLQTRSSLSRAGRL